MSPTRRRHRSSTTSSNSSFSSSSSSNSSRYRSRSRSVGRKGSQVRRSTSRALDRSGRNKSEHCGERKYESRGTKDSRSRHVDKRNSRSRSREKRSRRAISPQRKDSKRLRSPPERRRPRSRTPPEKRRARSPSPRKRRSRSPNEKRRQSPQYEKRRSRSHSPRRRLPTSLSPYNRKKPRTPSPIVKPKANLKHAEKRTARSPFSTERSLDMNRRELGRYRESPETERNRKRKLDTIEEEPMNKKKRDKSPDAPGSFIPLTSAKHNPATTEKTNKVQDNKPNIGSEPPDRYQDRSLMLESKGRMEMPVVQAVSSRTFTRKELPEPRKAVENEKGGSLGNFQIGKRHEGNEDKNKDQFKTMSIPNTSRNDRDKYKASSNLPLEMERLLKGREATNKAEKPRIKRLETSTSSDTSSSTDDSDSGSGSDTSSYEDEKRRKRRKKKTKAKVHKRKHSSKKKKKQSSKHSKKSKKRKSRIHRKRSPTPSSSDGSSTDDSNSDSAREKKKRHHTSNGSNYAKPKPISKSKSDETKKNVSNTKPDTSNISKPKPEEPKKGTNDSLAASSTKDVKAKERDKLKPMTYEDYLKQQSTIRKVEDPETGRTRLIRGTGEIIEEPVSRARQQDINRQATISDGTYFQGVLQKAIKK